MATTIHTAKEPSWHRNLRRKRQKARLLIRTACSQQLGVKTRAKVRKALGVLRAHHTWNPREIPWTCLATMTWFCQTCRIQNSQKLTSCRQCKAHWTEVWKEKEKKRRSRSKSKQDRRQAQHDAAQLEQETDDLDLFAKRAPWVTTTPTTRAVSARSDMFQTTDLPIPPPPVLHPPPVQPVILEDKTELTAEEKKKLQHLRGLKDVCTLPEELSKDLQLLEQKEINASKDRALNHGHINKFKKIRGQITALKSKVVDLDKEWYSFVEKCTNKLRNHAVMFQECRGSIMENLNAKYAELEQLREEVSKASKTLVEEHNMMREDMPPPNIDDALTAVQQVALQAGTVEPICVDGEEQQEENMEDAELLEEDAVTATAAAAPRVKLQPFRGSGSPTKVAQGHLKPKETKNK